MYVSIWTICVCLSALSIVNRNIVIATFSFVFAVAFYFSLPLLGDVKNAYVLTLEGRSYDHMEVGFALLLDILISQLNVSLGLIFNIISAFTFIFIALAAQKICSRGQKQDIFFVLPCIAFSQVFFLFSENIVRQGLSISVFLVMYTLARYKTLTTASLVFHKSAIILLLSFLYGKITKLFKRDWFFYIATFLVLAVSALLADNVYSFDNFAMRNNDRFTGLMKPLAQSAYILYLSRSFRKLQNFKDIIYAREIIVMLWFSIVFLGNTELASRIFVFIAMLDLLLAIAAQLRTKRNRLNKAFFVVTAYNLASPSVYVML